MIPNNNLNILPFYSGIDEQDYKKYYAFGEIYTLIAPNSKILPFQINRAAFPNLITTYVQGYYVSDGVTYTPSSTYWCTDFIDVVEGQAYKRNTNTSYFVYAYDSGNNPVVVNGGNVYWSTTFNGLVIPAGVAKIRVVFAPENLETVKVIKNEDLYGNITVANLHNINTGGVTGVLSHMLASGLEIKNFGSYELIINTSALMFASLTITPAQYYLELSDGVNTWYSEIFTVVRSINDYLKLEYYDLDNIAYTGGHIDYTAPYKNYCYLQTEIGKPEYPFEEEAQQRDGYIFIEKQISEKRYKFEFLAPEYLCDALRVVRMHDYINIYFKGKTYKVENIIFEPKWREQGNLAVVEVEFECDTVIKKVGKGITQGAGSFNNDFNNDFN